MGRRSYAAKAIPGKRHGRERFHYNQHRPDHRREHPKLHHSNRRADDSRGLFRISVTFRRERWPPEVSFLFIGAALPPAPQPPQEARSIRQLSAVSKSEINDQPIQLQYVSPTQIDAIIPDNATGAPRIVVRSPSGQRGLNILIEPTVPVSSTVR